MTRAPVVIVIGGPNGAGKTTISRAVIGHEFGVVDFVNADAIAQGLSGFNPESAAFAAGRLMLSRVRELAGSRDDFAFETTLASRSFAPWLQQLVGRGYSFHLLYVWVRTPELAMRRVRNRVKRGGHYIEPEVVRRRYARSISNFWHLYKPLASTWRIYDNSGRHLQAVASGGTGVSDLVIVPRIWQALQRGAHAAAKDE